MLLLLSCSVMSDSLRPHGLQHSRLSCPSPSAEACSNSCPLSQWCHPTIWSSVIPFASCLQSFPASGSFLMSWLFVSSGQSLGASASPSVLPMNIQDWFILGLTGSRDSQQSSPAPQFESINSLARSLLYGSTLTSVHDYRKNHSLIIQTFVGKVMSLLFNMLSRFVIAFLLRTKCLLISWLQSSTTMIFEPKKIKPVTVSTFSLSVRHEIKGLVSMILVFWMLSYKPAFSVSSFTKIEDISIEKMF